MKRRYRHDQYMRYWDMFGTLYYSTDALETSTREALEAYGHESPNRIPPPDLAELVRRG